MMRRLKIDLTIEFLNNQYTLDSVRETAIQSIKNHPFKCFLLLSMIYLSKNDELMQQ
jgi:hypothetical protein